jgi:lipopolysaccharide transport system ATP-binding protein
MKDVSDKEGRTVLFVSHNMTAIKNLCDKVYHFRNGKLMESGSPSQVINNYLSCHSNNTLVQSFFDSKEAPGNERIKLKRVEICPVLESPIDPITVKTEIHIEIEFWNLEKDKLINLTLFLNTFSGDTVFANATEARILSKGLHYAICILPANFLNDDIYSVSLMFVGDGSYVIYNFENIISFEVNESRSESGWHGKWPGVIRPKLDFKILPAKF